MFCDRCGANVPEGARVCGRCGKTVFQAETLGTDPLLRRATLFLEEEEWAKADDYCEEVLDREPENAQAYLIKLMVRVKVKSEEGLGSAPVSFANWNSYRNACRFADDALRKRLEGYLQSTEETLRLREEQRVAQEEARQREEEKRRIESLYAEACRYQRASHSARDVSEALRRFEQIPGHEDAAVRAQECKRTLAVLKEQERHREFEEAQARKREKTIKGMIAGTVILVFVAVMVYVVSSVNAANAERETQIEQNLMGVDFWGTYYDFVSESSGGAVVTASEMTQYEVTYSFLGNGTVKTDTTKRYDKEPFLTHNGVQQWDSVTQYSETINGGDVHISFFGKITVQIAGTSYELTVDEDDAPVSILIGNTSYEKK